MTKLAILFVCSLLVAMTASAQEPAAEATALPRVVFTTTHGDIVVELESEKSKLTVANILDYVDSGFYDGTIFHRVIDEFMIQGGGFVWEEGKLTKKTTKAPVMNESKNGLSNLRGTLAMARTNNPHSGTAQFFINTVDNTRLDQAQSYDGWGYAVFGRVVSGMEVVDTIAKVKTQNIGPQGNVPVEPVIIESARRVPAGAPTEDDGAVMDATAGGTEETVDEE